jgi:hypothetical protein
MTFSLRVDRICIRCRLQLAGYQTAKSEPLLFAGHASVESRAKPDDSTHNFFTKQ